MAVCLTPGRDFRWSPEWDCSDASVLFDASSGDFWLLSPAGRAAVTRLQQRGPLPAGDLLDGLPASPEGADSLLQELARSGIIERSAGVAAGGLEPAPIALD